jgi:hypothetical protein
MDNSYQQLSTEDLSRLVAFIYEDYGGELDKLSFTELFLLMLEDVSGIEKGPLNESEIIDMAYLMYQQQKR